MIPKNRIDKAAAILGCSSRRLERALVQRQQETAKARAAGLSREEWLRRNLAAAEYALRRVYSAFGPRHRSKGVIRVLSPRAYAKMTKPQVDAQYDFESRRLMHAVAKALVRADR